MEDRLQNVRNKIIRTRSSVSKGDKSPDLPNTQTSACVPGLESLSLSSVQDHPNRHALGNMPRSTPTFANSDHASPALLIPPSPDENHSMPCPDALATGIRSKPTIEIPLIPPPESATAPVAASVASAAFASAAAAAARQSTSSAPSSPQTLPPRTPPSASTIASGSFGKRASTPPAAFVPAWRRSFWDKVREKIFERCVRESVRVNLDWQWV